MDIHKPKPWHSAREFLKEYLIIVVGVLTALGAEQLVEHVRDLQHSRDARENVRAEIGANLGALAQRRLIESCVSRRLDEADELLRRAAAGQVLPDPIWIGHTITFPMRDSQYRTAGQSGRLSLLPTSEQADYANIYASLGEYGEASRAEMDAWSDLRALERRPSYSPALDWGLRRAIQQARQARWMMETAGSSVERNAARRGIRPALFAMFTQHSACLPLNTPRAEGLKLVATGRNSRRVYDEP